MNKKPLVSYLCVSNGRPNHLRKAIHNFLTQTYQPKELVILSYDWNTEYRAIVNEFNNSEIKYFEIPAAEGLTLGDLRNFSIEKSRGEYFCVWDDDDWNHPRRIEYQMNELIGANKAGSILAYCVIYDSFQNMAYLSHPLFHPATIICKKEIISDKIRYARLNRREDEAFFNQLVMAKTLFPIVHPMLYVYTFHSTNTSTADHFTQLLKNAYPISQQGSRLIGNIINGQYAVGEVEEILKSSEIFSEFDYFKYFLTSIEKN